MIRRLFFWIAKNHWLIRLNFFANRFLFAALILLLAYLGTRVDPNERDRYSNNTPLRGHDSVVTQLAFHPTKKWIASADEAGEIILWDMQGTFREIRKYQIPLDAHDGAIQQMLFTPDGDWLISGGVDHQLIFWATEQLSNETYEDYQSFYPFTDASQTYLNGFAQDEHTAPIEYLEVSPDGNWLASADSAGMIYLWNLTKINYDADTQWFKFLEAPIQLHLGNQLITDITFSQSSRYFAASANFDQGNIHVWDLTKVRDPDQFSQSKTLFTSNSKVLSITFDLNRNEFGEYQEANIFSGHNNRTVQRWSLEHPEESSRVIGGTQNAIVESLLVTRGQEDMDSYWLISINGRGTVTFWDMKRYVRFDDPTPALEFHTVLAHTRPINTALTGFVIHSGDGQTAQFLRHMLVTGSDDQTIVIWNLNATPAISNTITLTPRGKQIRALSLSANNELLLTTGSDKIIHLWDLRTMTRYTRQLPLGNMIRFMIPILLGLMLALRATTVYLAEAHNVSNQRRITAHILQAIFGVSFRNIWWFLLSLLWPIYPQMRIDDGKPEVDEDNITYVDEIGGPAKVMILPGNIVQFQTLRRVSAIVDNRHYITRPFEVIRNIINLDDQEGHFDTLTAVTRDGIEVDVNQVRFQFRVRFLDGCFARTPENPYPYDDEALNRAIAVQGWKQRVEGIIRGFIVEYINTHTLDFLTAPRGLDMETRVDFREWMRSRTEKPLFNIGAQMFWIDVGSIRIPDETIAKIRADYWAARLDAESEASVARNRGWTKRKAMQRLGKARAEAAMIENLLRSIEGVNLNLADPTLVKQMILARAAEILRAYESPEVDLPPESEDSKESKDSK